MKNPFYITTTLPYVNADPHIGHAMEFIRADVIARFKRSVGYDVFFNSGTDEHGVKLYEAALKENLTPQEYVDKGAERFKEFLKLANISNDGFVRTTDEKHIKAAQKIWSICFEKGDIYKAKQTIKYCIGCEMEKTDSELVEEKCPDHPNRELDIREEENYFFKFSKYQNELLKLYSNSLVIPESKQNEIRNFVASGLHDFSVSRLKSKMPWGVEVPNDNDHVMYVWFDALTSYIATLDWGNLENGKEVDSQNNFSRYWLQNENQNRQVIQYCGKDNNKAQSAIWQSMLLSAGIPNTSNIIINGHIISGGVKMSKSIGNVISPFDIIEKYKSVAMFPEDVLRFAMCHEVSTFEDSDITNESIQTAYASYLQNGLGNQLNRVLKLSSQYLSLEDIENIYKKLELEYTELEKGFVSLLNEFKINEAIHTITDKIKKLDEYIQSSEPFKLVKIDESKTEAENIDRLEKGKEIIRKSILEILNISHHMYFFMPNTCYFIYNQIKKNEMPEKALFAREGKVK